MARVRDRLRGCLSFLSALLFLVTLSWSAPAQKVVNCAQSPLREPQATISHAMLDDVCLWRDFPAYGIPIQYFDDYSWRSFLALIWPAKQGQRGQPDASLSLDATSGPTVFETFKAEWEVFQPNGERPTSWNEYGGRTPCVPSGGSFGDVTLAAFSHFDNIVQAGSSGALVAQNRTYVRYSTGFNEPHFGHILGGKYYLRDNLSNFVPFPSGAIAAKSAWIDMRGIARPERFHTRDAWLLDVETGKCQKTRVGLVGLHIVTKTSTHPQWIWSTFEHVDNVPGPHAMAPFTFNKGDDAPMPAVNPVECPFNAAKGQHMCPASPPQPHNVERLRPIYDRASAFSTVKTNEKYRAVLARHYPNSPWQFYQLVMTQWPLTPSRPDLDGSPANTFPGAVDSKLAIANTVLETFDQTDINLGCMGCHNHAAYDKDKKRLFDFVFSLATRAYPRDPSALHVDQLKSPTR